MPTEREASDQLPDVGEGMFRGMRKLGLERQLRIHIGVALTVMPKSTWNLLNAEFVTGRTVAREAMIERIVKGLSAFDIRWKGDSSLDPDALPPNLRLVCDNKEQS